MLARACNIRSDGARTAPTVKTRLLARVISLAPAVVLVSLVSLFSLSSVEARAEDRQAARRHFEAGKRLFEARDYPGALREFQNAQRSWNSRTFYFNIAAVYARMGETLKAGENLHRYLKLATPRERVLPEELQRIWRLVGVLVVRTPSREAEVLVNGALVGKGEVERVVFPGPHLVTVRVAGRVVSERTLVAVAGRHETWTLLAGPFFGPKERDIGTQGPPYSKGSQGDEPPVQDGRRRGRVHLAYFATAAALAGASLAAAGGLYARARKLNQDYLEDLSQASLRTEGLAYQHATNAMLALSGASALTAVILAFFTRWRPDAERRASVLPAPTPNGLGLSFVGSFDGF
jgi:tetratricopeptide (TPR) repeat protein